MLQRLQRQSDDQGFTLIELLIVIVILAILAAIVVFAVGTTGTNSAKSACKADAKSVETSLEAYKAQNNNAYPTPAVVVATGATVGTTNWPLLTTTGPSGSPYLRQAPGTSHYTMAYDAAGNVWVAGATTTGNGYSSKVPATFNATPAQASPYTDANAIKWFNLDTDIDAACGVAS